jgi:hypothetical protein
VFSNENHGVKIDAIQGEALTLCMYKVKKNHTKFLVKKNQKQKRLKLRYLV